jgi:peptidoglycan/LPS O-acetylase OafA/YrhL
MGQTFESGHHYTELDSLRGLAAFTVLITHYSNLFLVQAGPFVSAGRAIRLLGFTPLAVLFAGHEAVMLFFVHSGFVLSLQFLKGKPIPYGSFAIRRIFRIYVPYLAALIPALVCCSLLYRGHIDELSSWFNTPWSEGVSLHSVTDHVLFIGSFKSDRFNPVLWSLVHELRISFLFPFLIAFLMTRGWKLNLTLAVALSLFGLTATFLLVKFGIHLDYFLTVHYIAMFISGYVLAQNINSIYEWYRKRSLAARVAFGLAGLCTYTFSHLVPGRLQYLQDLPIAVGATLMIITAVCSLRASRFLNWPALRFLGKISYSLYLYHAIVLFAFTHAFYGRIPVGLILFAATASTVLVSWISYRYIELPAIQCGKSCSGRWERRKAPTTGSVFGLGTRNANLERG